MGYLPMFDVLDLVAAKYGELLSGKTFDVPTAAEKAAMNIIKLGIQSKKSFLDGSDCPFTVLRLRGGDDSPAAGRFNVEMVCGLHCKPDRDGDGTTDSDAALVANSVADMQTILNAFRGMADMGAVASYAPYSLEGIVWTVGDKDGSHPSPDCFELRAVLTFSQEPVF